MANIKASGVDLTTGQAAEVTPGDILTDSAGNPIAPASLANTLIAGNTSGANNVVIVTGQAVEGDAELRLTANEDVEIDTPSSFSIYIGSNQGPVGLSGNDNLYLDAGFDTFIGGEGGRGGNVTIGQELGSNTVTIYNMDAPNGGSLGVVSSGRTSASVGETGNGLILISPGGTKIGGLTGPPITLGPVYYNPQTGQSIRFGNSIFLDGDGTTNTISGSDGDQDKEEGLASQADDGTTSPVDLSVVGPISDSPLTPGSVTIQIKTNAAPTTFATVTDDGAGGFPSGTAIPLGGTITYATGAMTGITETLAPGSDVTAFYLVDNTAGEKLTPRGGNATGTADGGDLDLQGGAADTTGAGGDVLITSGDGGSTSGSSGDVDISIGTTTSGTPGTVKVNSLPLPTVLASVASIDVTSTGTTTLFTVPTGRSVMVTGIYIQATTATAAGADGVISVGTNASTYDDIITATTLTGLNATTETFVINTAGVIHIAAAAEVITFQVDTADTGTALTVTAHLTGFIL